MHLDAKDSAEKWSRGFMNLDEDLLDTEDMFKINSNSKSDPS